MGRLEEEVKIHPIELLSKKATLASPMVLAMTFGNSVMVLQP